MKSKLAVLSILAVLLLGTVAPSFGTRASAATVIVPAAPVAGLVHSNPAFFDRSRFLLHMGFAYYAFHHFVYAKYRAGNFSKGAPHRLLNLTKAAIALVVAYHEIKVSVAIANGSSSNLLHTLVKPINALGAKMNNTANQFRSGNLDANQIKDLARTSDVVGAQAGGITDHAFPIQGL